MHDTQATEQSIQSAAAAPIKKQRRLTFTLDGHQGVRIRITLTSDEVKAAKAELKQLARERDFYTAPPYEPGSHTSWRDIWDRDFSEDKHGYAANRVFMAFSEQPGLVGPGYALAEETIRDELIMFIDERFEATKAEREAKRAARLAARLAAEAAEAEGDEDDDEDDDLRFADEQDEPDYECYFSYGHCAGDKTDWQQLCEDFIQQLLGEWEALELAKLPVEEAASHIRGQNGCTIDLDGVKRTVIDYRAVEPRKLLCAVVRKDDKLAVCFTGRYDDSPWELHQAFDYDFSDTNAMHLAAMAHLAIDKAALEALSF